jgi:hypothetical protein
VEEEDRMVVDKDLLEVPAHPDPVALKALLGLLVSRARLELQGRQGLLVRLDHQGLRVLPVAVAGSASAVTTASILVGATAYR